MYKTKNYQLNCKHLNCWEKVQRTTLLFIHIMIIYYLRLLAARHVDNISYLVIKKFRNEIVSVLVMRGDLHLNQ